MPDYDVRIRATADVADLKKANAETRQYATELKSIEYQYRQGKISQDQYFASLGNLVNRMNAANLTFKNTVDLNAAVYQSQQRVSVGWKSMAVALNDVNNSIKQKATPTVIEFTRVIQDAPFGIRGVANNIQQLSTTFGQLTQSAGGVLPALRAMMMTMLSGPMAIMTGVSVVTSLASAFSDKLFPSAEKSAKQIDEVKKSLDEARDSIEAFISSIDKWENKLKGDDSGAKQSVTKEEAGLLMARVTALQAVIDAQANKTNVVLNDQYINMAQQTAQRLEAEAAIGRTLAQNKLILDGLKGSYAAAAAAANSATVYGAGGGGGSMMSNSDYLALRSGTGESILQGRMKINPFGRPSGSGESIRRGGINSLYGIGKVGKMQDTTQSARVTLGEFMQYSVDFENAFMSGIGNISNAISSRIGSAFASVFGGAKTMLGGFVNMFMQALTEMAIKAAALFAFNLILPGAGSMPMGGSPFGDPTGSAKSISGLGMSSRVGSGFNVNISQPEVRIENDAIVLAYKRGERARARRTA